VPTLHDRPTEAGWSGSLLGNALSPFHQTATAARSLSIALTDTAALLDLEGPPTYAEAWWRLTDEELDEIADLAARQATRFRDEANRLGAELGKKHDEADEPRGRWDPNTAAWLERE